MTGLAKVVRRVVRLGGEIVVVELVPGDEPRIAFRDYHARTGRIEMPLASVRTIAYAKAAELRRRERRTKGD